MALLNLTESLLCDAHGVAAVVLVAHSAGDIALPFQRLERGSHGGGADVHGVRQFALGVCAVAAREAQEHSVLAVVDAQGCDAAFDLAVVQARDQQQQSHCLHLRGVEVGFAFRCFAGRLSLSGSFHYGNFLSAAVPR